MSHLGNVAAAVVDGELGHDARDRALAHLAGCLSCRAEVETQRRLKARLAADQGPTAPADLSARLVDIASRPPGEGFADRPAVAGHTHRHPARSGAGPVLAKPDRSVPSQRMRRPFGSNPLNHAGPGRASSGRRRRLGRTVAAGASVIIVGLSAALALGGGPEPGGRYVDPSLSTLVADHLATTSEVSLTDPAMAAVSVSFPR